MKVSIHQPNFLPWLGLFDKIKNSDLFIVLDDVQFSHTEFQARNKIRVPDGFTWITVPVDAKNKPLNETRAMISDEWVKETIKKLDRSYSSKKLGQREFFKYNLIRWLKRTDLDLADYNQRILKALCEAGSIQTPFVRSSELGEPGSGSDRIFNLCYAVGADVYLSGAGGRNYLHLQDFKRNGIKVEFQDFKHPVYEQTFPGFETNLSAIDKLFCTGTI